MVRAIAFVIGAGFALVLAIGLWGSVLGVITDPPPATAEEEFHLHPRPAHLVSDGIMGKFDTRQLQRGFQVYSEVCSACHSLRFVAFRDLQGLGYKEGQIKAIAAGWKLEQPTTNADTGEVATRKNIPSDRIPMPFANDAAARAANGGAVPPDLSYITRARHGAADYVYSLIGHGYRPQPAKLLKRFPDLKTPDGKYYNPFYANLNIAMPPPLTTDGQVQYADGTKSTVDQMAKDVAAFLVWTADPNLETRHQYGFMAVIFLLISSLLAFGAYRNIWRGVKH